MKLSTIIPIAILFDSSMVAGKSTFKEKQRTNRHKTIHNTRSPRKLKKTTKVVKDHITYIETGTTQTSQAKAPKQSSNQTAKTPKKSIYSALVDLEESAAQMENANDNTMAPSTAKTPKSNTDAAGAATGAPKSGKAYYAGDDEGDMLTSSKTQKSAADYSAADAATGAPKSGKAYYIGEDEGDMSTSTKTQKSAAAADAATGAPKSGKAYYATGAPKSGKAYYASGAPKSGKAYYATGAPKSGKAYYPDGDEADMPSSSKTQKSSKDGMLDGTGSGKRAKAFMYKKTKTVKDYGGSRTDPPEYHLYYRTEEPSLTPSVSTTEVTDVPSTSSAPSNSSEPSEIPSSTSPAPSNSSEPSEIPSTSPVPSLSSEPSKIPSTSPAPSLSSGPSITVDDEEIE